MRRVGSVSTRVAELSDEDIWPPRARTGRGERRREGAEAIRILLAEDMGLVRGALVALLSYEDDIEVVSELARGDQIVAAALEHRPDVAVIDIDLPGMDGIEAARLLRRELPQCRTLILTALGAPGTLRRALDASVAGFVVKDAPPAQLADSIRRVARGERVIDPELAVADLDAAPNPFTNRELDVLRLAAEGAPVGEIAERLSLARGTVRNYLSTIICKTGGRTRIEAVRIAQNAGWI